MKVIIPERFGCASKVALAEVMALKASATPFRNGDDVHDAATYVIGASRRAASIDKVYDLGLPPPQFARLSLAHCARDLVAVGATPDLCDIAFEFGADLDQDGRREISNAMFEVLTANEIAIGKIHSSYSFTTSVTLALSGQLGCEVGGKEFSKGLVVLSDRVGLLRELYMRALHPRQFGEPFQTSAVPDYSAVMSSVCPLIDDWTDVSGYGLLGALVSLQQRHSIAIEITCDDPSMVSKSTEPVPDCLQSEVANIDVPSGIGQNRLQYFTQREVCGPMLCLASEEHSFELISIFQKLRCDAKVIGTFERRLESK